MNRKFPNNFYYLVNRHLLNQIKEIQSAPELTNTEVIDTQNPKNLVAKNIAFRKTRYYADNIPDPQIVDKNTYFPKKTYWYFKNKFRQKGLHRQIEKFRRIHNIEVFIGVFSGMLPLVFYLNQTPRKAAVIFSDMDSWFSDVHSNMKRLWYRRFYSFNYALENADIVDFLSPFIYDEIRKKGIKIKDSVARIAPCSFADYTKCESGDKTEFEIAFASRLEPDKNPIIYLEAAKIISKEFPNIRFHILGEGSLAFEIEKFIADNQLDKIISFQFHKNPPDIFKFTSIFVSLQSFTNYPSQSILEAMACGNAIIASNKGDTNLFINEKNGVLIDLNTGDLIKAMRFLIINKNHTAALGTYARRFALENHNIEKFEDYYIRLINEARSSIH